MYSEIPTTKLTPISYPSCKVVLFTTWTKLPDQFLIASKDKKSHDNLIWHVYEILLYMEGMYIYGYLQFKLIKLLVVPRKQLRYSVMRGVIPWAKLFDFELSLEVRLELENVICAHFGV